MHQNNESSVIDVSIPILLVSMAPLLMIAGMSSSMGLGLERHIVVGTFRSAAQLSICGLVLKPVFDFGAKPHFDDFGWLLVLLYSLLMIFLASWEASRRSKYTFDGLFPSLWVLLLTNICWVSIFAFGGLLRPSPIWSPFYVIPIVGMLLGNCVNGVALALDHSIISLKEKTAEMELLLAFGATCEEATAPFLRESIRVGTMPLFNNMAVIGLISIPGMMTGQILAGAPVVQSARYQILILYLIGMCSFGTVLSEIWVTRRAGCDFRYQRFRSHRFRLQDKSKGSLLVAFKNVFENWRFKDSCGVEGIPLTQEEDSNIYGTQPHPINLSLLRSSGQHSNRDVLLDAHNLSLSVKASDSTNTRITLFRDLSLNLRRGDLVSVSAPSGAGKSQLLRAVAGLTPLDKGTLQFSGSRFVDQIHAQEWRRHIRYVSQYKVDALGTPLDFIEQISSLDSWKRAPNHLVESVCAFVSEWGLKPCNCLEKEWKHLSGGESQRVYLAICLASRPQVLLMDESTSAIDVAAKILVERSVLEAARNGTAVLWISHDEDQRSRIIESGSIRAKQTGSCWAS